jgi:Protein of unknwon function (DUF3310)
VKYETCKVRSQTGLYCSRGAGHGGAHVCVDLQQSALAQWGDDGLLIPLEGGGVTYDVCTVPSQTGLYCYRPANHKGLHSCRDLYDATKTYWDDDGLLVPPKAAPAAPAPERSVARATDTQVGGSHYKQFQIQPIEFITKNNIPFIEGCIIKYACRHDRKNGRQDVEKIIHYAQLLLQLKYPEEGKTDDDGK